MIKEIIHDEFFLSRPAEPATQKDKQLIQDLQDTLKANADRCVGMAANMIGVSKAMIIFTMGKTNVVMINPIIVKKSKPFETEEGCLSLQGVRPVTRYEEILVNYQDEKFRKQQEHFTGWTAQIIQHECDHLEGILI